MHMRTSAQTAGNVMDPKAVNNEFSVTVKDGSLEPYIHKGDTLILVKTDYEKMAVGDFVLYRLDNGESVVRRIIAKGTSQGRACVVTRWEQDEAKKEQVIAAHVVRRVTHVISSDGKRVRAGTLNRGLLDWLTQYGTRLPLFRLVELLLILIPPSMRPGHLRNWLPTDVTVINGPKTDKVEKVTEEETEKLLKTLKAPKKKP